MLPTKFRFIWPSGFRGEDFFKIGQSETRIACGSLKIEISSNGQNCSILSQKVLKFELYKHNDELFNILQSPLRMIFLAN